MFLKVIFAHTGTYQVTAEVYIGRTHLAVAVNLVDTIYMMVGCNQTVTVLQLQQLVDLTRVNQTVTTKDKFIITCTTPNKIITFT